MNSTFEIINDIKFQIYDEYCEQIMIRIISVPHENPNWQYNFVYDSRECFFWFVNNYDIIPTADNFKYKRMQLLPTEYEIAYIHYNDIPSNIYQIIYSNTTVTIFYLRKNKYFPSFALEDFSLK